MGELGDENKGLEVVEGHAHTLLWMMEELALIDHAEEEVEEWMGEGEGKRLWALVDQARKHSYFRFEKQPENPYYTAASKLLKSERTLTRERIGSLPGTGPPSRSAPPAYLDNLRALDKLGRRAALTPASPRAAYAAVGARVDSLRITDDLRSVLRLRSLLGTARVPLTRWVQDRTGWGGC